MTAYEKLLHEAYSLGLIVKEVNLLTRKGRCVGNRIAIDTNIQTDAEKACILREEIAHYKTTVGDISDQTKIENRKKELIARRYGYKFILDPLDIVYAMKLGCSNIYEIADFYELTIEEFTNIIDNFKKQYGIGKRFDEYFIAFEPTFAFIKMFDDENVC